MIVRVAFFILMSLGLIGFGTVAWITTRPMGLGGPPPTKMILVAAQPIQGGSLLTSDDLQQKEISSEEMVKEYNVDTPDIRRGLMGAMVKRNLGAGEAVRSDDLMRPTDHGFMAAVLSPGMRAVTISVDAASGSSGLIWPGDRVDLILTQVNQDATLGRRVSAHTVLTNVRVVAVDSQLVSAPNRNAPAPSIADAQNRTVTLEVDEDQAQRVAVGMRLGKLSVSVRASASTNGIARTEKREATFAEDILPDLAAKPAPPPAPVVVAPPEPPPVMAPPPLRVFSGPGEAKEFKF